MKLTCFKAYDVRGRVGDELNGETAWRIGRAYGDYLRPRRVAVGGDVRPSSEELKAALADGLRASGAEVLDLGLTGTEEVYFAVFSQNLDGGLEVTGSHNPLADNGIKFVGPGARPISGDSGLREIQSLAESGSFKSGTGRGRCGRACFRDQYVEHLLSYVQVDRLPEIAVVANAGHGTAGPALDALEERLKALGAPLEFVKICHEPDGSFPRGVPNPLLPENRNLTAEAVREHGADVGLAWDGDFDRCFFFDENADFIEGYYLVGLLAEAFLAARPGAAVIHDPRLTWNTIDLVLKSGGRPVECKTGHAFIKERMRAEKAVYGGEMSAHHYFADFAYCDSGMIPWLLVLQLMGRKKQPLSALVAERRAKFPCSGEINYRAAEPGRILASIENRFAPQALKVDHLDGLSVEMPDWRFNLRLSNTEPLLRLNLETRGDEAAVRRHVAELEALVKA